MIRKVAEDAVSDSGVETGSDESVPHSALDDQEFCV